MKSKVYFSKEISPEMVVDMYDALGIDLEGKIAVKIHSGEEGNTNFLRPEFWKPMVDRMNGTIVECNTAYGDRFGGVREHTESNLKLLASHGWSQLFDVDLMDSEGPTRNCSSPMGSR